MLDNSTLASSPSVISDLMCFGFNDGIVTANVSGGTPEYTYAWFAQGVNDTISKAETAEDLVAGIYVLHVDDSETCKRIEEVEVTDLEKVTFELKDTVLNDCYYGDCEAVLSTR